MAFEDYCRRNLDRVKTEISELAQKLDHYDALAEVGGLTPAAAERRQELEKHLDVLYADERRIEQYLADHAPAITEAAAA